MKKIKTAEGIPCRDGVISTSQLTRVIEKTLTGTVAGVHAFGYDPAGNMTTMQKSGGTPNAVNVTTRAHNPLNQVTALSGGGATLVRGVLNEPGSASIAKAGQPLVPARMTAGNTFEEELNLSTGQNTIAVRAEDATGNVSNYNFRTDIAPVTARNFTYDADGNMTSDGILTYEWDCLNRLTRINRGGTKATRFFYNALGQRIVIGEVDGSTYTDLRFLSWDGIQLLSMRKGPASSGYAGARYERRYYPQGEQSLYQDPPSGDLTVTATHHYTRDHLGSVREVLKSDGTLQARYDYDPYGKRIAQYESTAYGACPFGFTGHYTQKSPIVGQGELVLTHFRAYDPELGRWLSADPIGEAGGINLYGYVENDPVNSYDPLGLLAWQNWAPVVNQRLSHSADFMKGAHSFEKNASVACVGVAAVVAVAPAIPTATVAIGTGGRVLPLIPGFHVVFGAGGKWLHGPGLGNAITSINAARNARNAWFTLRIPVLSEAAVMSTTGAAKTCVHAAGRGIARGWTKPIADGINRIRQTVTYWLN